MANFAQLLAETEAYLEQSIAPIAGLLDQDPVTLHRVLEALCDRDLMALKVSPQWGGAGLDERSFRAFQELLARYSGSLAFLQTQHQSAVGMLAQGSNEFLKREYLPLACRGQILLGVGFSQLRRMGTPLVTAVPVTGGYQINGEVPWVTGYGSFQLFVVGARLPDRQALFGLLPFTPQQQVSGGEIVCSEPLQLAAMQATNTVKVFLKDWFVPHSRVLSVQSAGWIEANDQRNVLHHSFFALGCARAGLDIAAIAKTTLPDFADTAWRSLDQELLTCRSATYTAHQQTDNTAFQDVETLLSLRAWAIDLAVRCAEAAVVVSRGAGCQIDHPAQRVYREALAFTVFGQTTAVMAATLKRLVRST